MGALNIIAKSKLHIDDNLNWLNNMGTVIVIAKTQSHYVSKHPVHLSKTEKNYTKVIDDLGKTFKTSCHTTYI